MERLHNPKWIEEKQCWRLVHPMTGDFIAEWYPQNNTLAVTKHRKTGIISLGSLAENGQEYVFVKPIYGE